MKTIRTIQLKLSGTIKEIKIGYPETERERSDVYKLRYLIYNEKGYINAKDFSVKEYSDEYDQDNKSTNVVAKIGEETIGSIRITRTDPLPIVHYFDFEDPLSTKFSADQKIELGKLVIRKYQNEGCYLPRNLVLLGMLSVVLGYCGDRNVEIGYAFIKESLKKKMQKLNIPINYVAKYSRISDGGVLKKYFSQPTNPSFPVYFLRKEMSKYVDNVFNKKSLFQKKDESFYILKDNLYTKFLKKLKII